MRYSVALCYLLVATVCADSSVKDLKIITEDPEFYHVATLVSPRNLLESFKSTDLLLRDESKATSTCFNQLELLFRAIASQDLWALKMVDASSKIPAGILQGNFIDLGMYDECMAIRNDTLEIRGSHCMYTTSISLQGAALPLALSICIPASCSSEEVKEFVAYAINKVAANLNVTISTASCAPVDEKTWDTEFIVCFTILVIYLKFLIVSTACEVICDRSSNLGQNRVLSTLTQFSLKKNAAAIFNMEVRKGNIPALHGIRFISMAWVVLSHEYSLFIKSATVNVLDALEWSTSWQALYVFLGFFAVDAFFAISGFLMTYLFMKQIPKEKTFNVPLYYLHRFLRLTPALIALIAFTIVFVPKIGSGALWHVHSRNTTLEGCREKWWPILLYVENFVRRENPCLGHLWYLAVDMQLFWLSPVLLYPLYKKPKLGLTITTLLLLASLITPTLIVALNEYRPISFLVELDTVKMTAMFKEVYIATYNRAAAWLVGILMGYELARNQKPKKCLMQIGWILAMVGFVFCIYGTRYFTAKDYKYDAVLEGLFMAFSRPTWGFAICWIVYASFHNYGGVISTILSCRAFLPLSRLSYCIYLVHYVTENMQFEAARTTKYFSDYYVWYYFLGDFAISIAIALCFSLLFESPMLALEKMIFKRENKSISDSQQNLKSYTSSEESIGK